jgi:glyoxylate reductase
MHGRTLGIVGLGRIGRAVAERARGFSLRVLYHQRQRLDPALERDASYVSLDELLSQSDFVSLHVPLSTESVHLIGARELSLVKAGAVLVNTSRGALVDEAALADALASGKLAAAGLDVFEREPSIEPRLLRMDNVVLAPHIASATDETRAAMARSVSEDVARVLRGQEPRSRVNS